MGSPWPVFITSGAESKRRKDSINVLCTAFSTGACLPNENVLSLQVDIFKCKNEIKQHLVKFFFFLVPFRVFKKKKKSTIM